MLLPNFRLFRCTNVWQPGAVDVKELARLEQDKKKKEKEHPPYVKFTPRFTAAMVFFADREEKATSAPERALAGRTRFGAD